MTFFDGDSWSTHSNSKLVAVKKAIFEDKWDENNTGSYSTITGNSVKQTGGNGYHSAFLSNVISKGIHIWTFKVEHINNYQNLQIHTCQTLQFETRHETCTTTDRWI